MNHRLVDNGPAVETLQTVARQVIIGGSIHHQQAFAFRAFHAVSPVESQSDGPIERTANEMPMKPDRDSYENWCRLASSGLRASL